MRRSRYRVGFVIGIVAAVGVLALPSIGAGSPADTERSAGEASGLGSYAWKRVSAAAPWTARAGLQAVKLGGRMYVIGGRTPASPLIPFASVIFNDVWRSADKGASWEQVTDDAPWPARAYFEAVTRSRKHGDGKELFVLGGPELRPSPPSSSTTSGAAATAARAGGRSPRARHGRVAPGSAPLSSGARSTCSVAARETTRRPAAADGRSTTTSGSRGTASAG